MIPSRTPDPDDAWLRAALRDAVADIDPPDRLDEVLSRSGTRRTPWAPALVAAAVVAVVAVGVGVVQQDRSTPPVGTAPGSPTSSPTPSATPVIPARVNVPVYLVGDTPAGPRLFREFPWVDTTGTDDPATIAVRAMLEQAPRDPDYRSPWPRGTTAQVSWVGTSEAGDPADPDGAWEIVLRHPAVDLTRRPAGMAEAEAEVAVQQIVHTVQGAAGDETRHPVGLRVAGLGDAARTPAVLGVPVTGPVSAAPASEALADVWVIDPADGISLSAPFEVDGLAAAYEATVTWSLEAPDGTVVADGFATTAEAAVRAPYRFTVPDVAPGEYLLVVSTTDPSDGEGPGVTRDTKRVTVR
ncbi:MAG: Gmad2 immunoglobulin-like domain-containing protein [Nocardioides sp.]|nr:Gmad2 immunoglobulin-like domain-containing protein [Nocardioides sp.]